MAHGGCGAAAALWVALVVLCQSLTQGETTTKGVVMQSANPGSAHDTRPFTIPTKCPASHIIWIRGDCSPFILSVLRQYSVAASLR